MLLALIADQLFEPVVMNPVTIGPPAPITGGTVSDLTVGASTAQLFVPTDWKPRRRNRVCVHFHSAAWYVVSQYQAVPMHDPVVTFNLGQGSTVYAQPFTAKDSFEPWKQAIEEGIHGRMGNLVVTSFSAGYGAVRELVKQPEFLNRLETVVLSDSMYGSFAEPLDRRIPLKDHVDCWKPLVQRALDGKTTVVMTCSSIAPAGYSGTHEVSKALVGAMGGTMTEVPDQTGEMKLLRRYDKGQWHVWHYDGITPEAHMTQARHMADVLRLVYPPKK